MHWKRSAISAGIFVAIGILATNSIAIATPGSGAAPSTPLVIGTLDGPQKSEADGIEFKTEGDVAVLDFELTYNVGGYSGWHAHPGIVIATVKSGTVERKPQVFNVGDTFTEVGPHFVSNPGTTPAVLSITQIVPADQINARRIDLPAPSC
jgi:quercetin dioxygenase-like cupin family protein